MKKAATALLFAATFALSACGGGSGGGGGSSAATPASTPIVSTCPTGVAAPGGDISKCTPIGPASTPVLTGIDPVAAQTNGFALPFNGTIDPSSVTLQNVKMWLGAQDTGIPVAGTVSLSADGKTVTFLPTQRLAYGASYTLYAIVKDTAAHSASWTVPFTMAARVCADNVTWSNPANYSAVYQDCVAPISVQTQISQAYNKVQDNTCIVPPVGQPLSVACKAYLANGTIALANTSIVVNSHLATWGVFVGFDGTNYLVLFDTNDPNNGSPPVAASAVLTSQLKWLIGNPTGAYICTADGKGSQVTLDTVNNLAVTYVRSC